MLLFSSNTSIAQEFQTGVNSLQLLLIDRQELLEANANITLQPYQWTDLDRIFFTPRFVEAMELIAINERTELLTDLGQIAGYYSFLSTHPKILEYDLKWPFAATALTGIVMPLWESGTEGVLFFGALIALWGQNNDPSNSRTYDELWAMMQEGLSPSGQQFLDGSASKRIVADVTRKFFGPLLRNELSVTSPFLLDAEILYEEQFVTLEPFYSNFSEVDRVLIVNGVIKSSLSALGTSLDYNSGFDLMNPSDRVRLGLLAMGYSRSDIEDFLSRK